MCTISRVRMSSSFIMWWIHILYQNNTYGLQDSGEEWLNTTYQQVRWHIGHLLVGLGYSFICLYLFIFDESTLSFFSNSTQPCKIIALTTYIITHILLFIQFSAWLGNFGNIDASLTESSNDLGVNFRCGGIGRDFDCLTNNVTNNANHFI